MSSMNCDDIRANPGCNDELSKLISGKTTDVTAKSTWENLTADEIVGEMLSVGKKLMSSPSAYIATDNRGKRYLVFADSVEYENAQMFGYSMEALYA